MPSSRAADVVVVGAGVIGCAIAWELARRGASVVVVERGVPGREATWAAGGMLSPLAESERAGPFQELANASFDRYPAFIDRLSDASGVRPAYSASGKLHVALDNAQAELLAQRFGWQRRAGRGVDLLDGKTAREMEPALAPDVRAGLFVARDHQVDNRELGRALWAAAANAGAQFRLGSPVADVAGNVAGDVTRATGVALASGEVVRGGTIVIAAGAWSGQIGGTGRPLPVKPVKGQLIAFEMVPKPIERMIASGDCYIVPRPNGRILVGATVEDEGFDVRPTAKGVAYLIGAALAALPALGSAELVEYWAGLRPGTPDSLPILGPDPNVDRLFYATGHYRNGILLAPITAELLASCVLDETPGIALEPFSIGRFAGRGADA